MDIFEAELHLDDALTLKRAEIWLEVGRPSLALQEMEDLGEYSLVHPWAVRILDAISTASPPQGVTQ